MTAALMKAAPFAVLICAALALAGCVVGPAPYTGENEGYYARPAPVTVVPRYTYGHRGYWYRHGWRGGAGKAAAITGTDRAISVQLTGT